MAGETILEKLSICIPQEKQKIQPVERPIGLGEKRDRLANYLVVEAIFRYLDGEESKK